MKRPLAMMTVLILVLTSFLWVADAWARAGGGSSGGSRGSRSYSAPARPSQGQMSPSRPTAPPPTPALPPTPQRSWGGMLGGLLLGGLLGGLLFGGLGGHGLFGGVGLLEIIVIGGLVLFAIVWMRRKQASSAGMPAPAYAGGYGGGSWQPTERSEPAAATAVGPPAELGDVDRGVGHIRQLDASFDAAAFTESASDMFFKIQAAWTTRDMTRVSDLMTPEMQGIFQEQCDRLRGEHRMNRLENIAVRQALVTEAWQEKGQDYVTVYFLASLLDYTTDETGSRILDGSATDPVKFEEYWTFVRPAGPNRFKLTAIQQAA